MTVFHANAAQLAQDNPFFNKVLMTGELRVSGLSLEPHEDVGATAQPADQAYWIAEETASCSPTAAMSA